MIALCFFLNSIFSLIFNFFILTIIYLRYYSFFDSLNKEADFQPLYFAMMKTDTDHLISYPNDPQHQALPDGGS